MRAWRAADTTGDGWIRATEFHSLLGYLAFFHHRWPLFNKLDEEHDGKIPIATIKEHCGALGLASPRGSAVAAAEHLFAFAELDPHDKGWVAFEEFCSFAARLHAVAPSAKQAWPDAGDSEAQRASPQSPAQTQAAGQVGDTSASSAGSLNAFSSPITEEDSGDAAQTAARVVMSPRPEASATSDVSPRISSGARSPQNGLTVSEAVQAIKTELALDSSLTIADAVTVAWKTLQLQTASGLPFKAKVQRLCAELDIQPGWS
jgi:hypothetical protein